jgi:hypothetical protein
MAQEVHTAQEPPLLLQGACLPGMALPESMQDLSIAMFGIIMVMPGIVLPLLAGTAQAGAPPLRNTPSATISAAIWRPTMRVSMGELYALELWRSRTVWRVEQFVRPAQSWFVPEKQILNQSRDSQDQKYQK